MGAPSVQNWNCLRIFGGMPSATISVQQAGDVNNAGVPETVAVGTDRRRIKGPKKNGHFSLQTFVDGAGGATSAMTVWYSNHPDPSLASDADWVQDTTIGTIDLTITGTKMFNAGNVFSEWIMLKAVIATSTANIRAFVRVEGVTVIAP